MSEYLPRTYKGYQFVWLVFDLSNGHKETRRYVWWFDTRREARDFVRRAKNDSRRPRYSKPMRFVRRELRK